MEVDLTPGELNLKLYAGDGTALTITAKDKDTDAPVPLDDRDWTATWRQKRTSSTGTDLAVDDTDAATGVLVVHFSGAQTAAFSPAGVWDLEGVPAGGEPDTLLTGFVVTEKDVTRAEP